MHCIVTIVAPPPPPLSFRGRKQSTTGPAEMSGKGKRRSARLLKLEEQKNDGGSTAAVCFLDPWQIIRNSISGPSARGKRKRNEGIQVKRKREKTICGHCWLLSTLFESYVCSFFLRFSSAGPDGFEAAAGRSFL